MVKCKTKSVRIPKKAEQFEAIYERIEIEIFKCWNETLQEGSLLIKAQLIRVHLMMFIFIVGILSQLMPYPLYLVASVPVLILLLASYFGSKLHYKLTNQVLEVVDTKEKKAFDINAISTIALQAQKVGQASIVFRFQGEPKKWVINGNGLSFPSATIYRFLKSQYGIAEARTI